MIEPLARPSRLSSSLGARLRLVPAPAGDQQRHRDVLERGEIGQQVVELIDEADALAPQPRALGIAQAAAGPPVDRDLAGARPLEQAGDVQERRLAGAGRADQAAMVARRGRPRSMPCSTSSTACPCEKRRRMPLSASTGACYS